MNELRNCKECIHPMDYAGCGDHPNDRKTPSVPATLATGRFWVRCPKCEKSVPLDAHALRETLESERRAASHQVGHLERTLLAWGIPYTPSKR